MPYLSVKLIFRVRCFLVGGIRRCGSAAGGDIPRPFFEIRSLFVAGFGFFVALVVLPQIRDLRHAGGCSVTIVTGDSVMTACHVASEVGLVGEIESAAGSSEPSPSNSSTTTTKKKAGGKEVKTANAEGGGEEEEAGRSDEKGKIPLLLTVVPTDDGVSRFAESWPDNKGVEYAPVAPVV